MTMLNNLKKLLIPRKGSAQTDDLDTNWRAIERWANALATSGFTPYASLTGPGETTTPGALAQEGDLTVVGTFEVKEIDSPAKVTVSLAADVTHIVADDSSGTSGSGVIDLTGSAIAIQGASGVGIATTTAPGNININAGFGVITIDGVQVVLEGPIVFVGSALGSLQFFGPPGTGNSQQTVTGSRGGNVALHNLLLALASYGLIVDATT